MNKNIIHGTMALLFVMVVCISSAAAVDDTVTRDLPAGVNAGASITVNLTVDVETSATYYLIDEAVPSGWTVTSATDDGDYTAEPGHVKWVVISGAADKVYSYTVTAPADASGAYTFSGEYMFEGDTVTTAVLGDDTVAIGLVDTVTRGLPASVNAGTSITVTLTVDIATGATYYLIDEVVPSGWTVTSATDDGDYTAEPGHVKWVVISGAADKVYSYTVTVPADASGAYTFSGVYMFEETTLSDGAIILGDDTVTVSEEGTQTLTWQTEPPASVMQGDDVIFDVMFSNPAVYYIRIENSTNAVVWRYPTLGTDTSTNPNATTWTTTTDTPTGDYTAIVNINGTDDADTKAFTVTGEGTQTLTWQTEPPASVMQGDDVIFDVMFSNPAVYYIRIENSTNAVVWRYPTLGTDTSTNPNATTWTTTTDTPTGDYTAIVNINGTDDADTKAFAVTEEGTPTLTWQTEPPASVMQGSSVTFDVNFSVTVEYYSRIEDSTGAEVWRYPTTGTGHTADPHPRTWTTTSATPGDYTIVININGDDNADTRTVTVTAAVPQNIVAIGDVTLGHGATTDVPIQLVNATGVGAGTVTLTFDPSIVNTTNMVVGDFDSNFNPDYSDVGTGTLRISCTASGADLTGDLTIATVTLDAVGTSGSCALGLSAVLSNKSGVAVTPAVSDGTFTISVAEDTTPPVITAVTNTTPTASAVTIMWTTDEASNSIVKYGTVSGTYTESKSSATLVTSHSITLTGLDSETTYYFVVNSTDASGNPSQSAEDDVTTAVEVVRINSWTLPATGTRGTSIDATVNITNKGTEAAWFVVSAAGTSAAGTSIVGLGTIELDAGETQVVNVKIPVPGDSGAAGTYTLYPDVYTFDGYPDVNTIQATGSGDTIVIS